MTKSVSDPTHLLTSDSISTLAMATGPQPLSDDAVAKKLAEFDSIPLFMKSLPSEETDDVALAALQSLVHEGTPDGW
jgi:hypothetical protein